MNKHSLVRKSLVGAASLVVIAAVSFTIYKHPPSQQRKMRYDNVRLSNLSKAEREIGYYWESHKRLPADLTALCKECRTDYRDPENNSLLIYEVTGDKSYRLCAVFSLPSDENLSEYRVGQRHDAGRACFEKFVK